MPKQKDEWILGAEASMIMTRNSGHTVNPAYVRLLSRNNKIRSKKLDGRTRAYWRADVEAYYVKEKSTGEK